MPQELGVLVALLMGWPMGGGGGIADGKAPTSEVALATRDVKALSTAAAKGRFLVPFPSGPKHPLMIPS